MSKDDVTTDDIVKAIQAGHRTAGAIERSLNAEMRAVDRALQKAKRDGRIVFDRFAREWRMSRGG